MHLLYLFWDASHLFSELCFMFVRGGRKPIYLRTYMSWTSFNRLTI
jgi:hypothetical protein